MHDTLTSLLLLALTVATLFATRGRGLLVRICGEVVLLLAIGIFLVSQGTSPLPQFGGVRVGLAGTWLRSLAVIWWLIGARLVVNVTILVRDHDPRSREAKLFSDLAAAVIYIATILIIFNTVLGLNVGALLVTSGVTAILLGLALQNTLADVFFGLAIGLEKPFHIGDRVSVGDGAEGVIIQMNWRSIRIHTDGDDLATIPNSVVAKGQIVNRSVPTSRRAGTVEIIAPSDISCETVFELIRQATLLCPIVLPVPAPSITIRRSGLRSSTYAASFFVPDSPSLTRAKSMLLCQVSRLFRQAGIGRSVPMTLVEQLQSVPLFEMLSETDVEALVEKLIIHSVGPGDTIFEQDAVATSFYLIAAGVMEISRQNSSSRNEMLMRIGAGDYIGELGLITASPRAFTVKSLTHGRVLELPSEGLDELRRQHARLNAMIERSVRKGRALIDRDDAEKNDHPAEHHADISSRIRAFLGGWQ
jgi:small-conductance mechanosensitive channel